MTHHWDFQTTGLSKRQAQFLLRLIELYVILFGGASEDFSGGFAPEPENWEESALSPDADPLGGEDHE